MKNYLKPISLTFMATVLFVSSANAGPLDFLNPKKIVNKIGNTLNPESKTRTQQPQSPRPAEGQVQEPTKDYGSSVPASAQLNQAVLAELGLNQTQIGQTAIDQNSVRTLYALKGNRALWTNHAGFSALGNALYDTLTHIAKFHGLEPKHYATDDVESLVASISDIMLSNDLNSLAKLDVLLTQGYIQFTKDLSSGRINPRDPTQNLKDIEMKKYPAPTLEKLAEIISDKPERRLTPTTFLNDVSRLAPFLVGYSALVESLAKINDGMEKGTWYGLDPSKNLKLNDSHPNVVGLRQRLVDFGYLPLQERSNLSQKYDGTMYNAIVKFQEYNFLGIDGVIGGEVYKIMMRTQQSFKNQIRANLEKWRFHPREFPQRYMMVDMGRQQLDVLDNGRLVLRMNTVVGKDVNGTPTMTDKVTSVLLAPYWHSPKSIMVKETIPNFGSDPAGYLAQRDVEVLGSNWQPLSPEEINNINWQQYTMENPPPYTFREKNGENNSLGLVKFNLNNGHSIYLHDTNNKGAFKKRVRYLSHGCIRLERPFDLVAYLLNGTTDPYQLVTDSTYWKNEAANIAFNMAKQRDLEAKLAGGFINSVEVAELQSLKAMKLKPEEIPVANIPVYIFGSTTVNYVDGAIGFGEDAYKQDERIIQVLDQVK